MVAMKRISIQSPEGAAIIRNRGGRAGETILITRHNEAVAQLAPAQAPHLHRGRLFGKGRIIPAVRKGTNGRYLKLLLEDRDDR